MPSKWSEDQITEALAIAAAVGIREASRRTGVPLATLHRHMQRAGIASGNGNGKSAPRRPPVQVMAEVIQARVAEQVTRRVAERLAERLEKLADRLYRLAEEAVAKVEVAISDRGEPHDRDGAAWVRALVGVMAQALDKAQLLSGKPTARPEVMQRHEYDITQRIIADPDAVALAEQLLQRAAGLDPGPLRLDGERGPVDPV